MEHTQISHSKSLKCFMLTHLPYGSVKQFSTIEVREFTEINSMESGIPA